jgi:Txe/YoeB family toxin of toxin-antitoxin system
VKWTLAFTRQADQDTHRLKEAGLKPKAPSLLDVLARNPYQSPPRFEKLVGDLRGAYSRRISIKHRLVYQIRDAERVVAILRMWSHDE